MADTLHYAGSDLLLSKDDIGPDLLSDLLDCGAGGQDALPAVLYIMANYTITGDESDCRAYLKDYIADVFSAALQADYETDTAFYGEA